MTPAETKAIYESACRSKRMVPAQEEGGMWHKALKEYEVRDVRAALDAWWNSTDRDSKGDLKSAWLPAPGELRPIVERERRKREVAAAEPKVYAGWECPKCRYRCGDFISPDDTRPRVCRQKNCGAAMTEQVRERKFA